jgi:hypothetical protein
MLLLIETQKDEASQLSTMKYQEGLDKEVLSRGFGSSFFRRTQGSTN